METLGRTKTALTLQAAVAPAVWGTTYLVTTELLPPDRPLLAGALRALPAGLLLLAVTRILPRGSWWWRALVLGTLNIGAFFALLFIAAYRLPGGVAATLGAVQPLAVAVLAVALLGEPLHRRRVGAGVAAVVGVSLLVLRGDAALDPVGIAAGLAGTASMALGIVLTKRWGQPVPVLAFAGWQLAAGGLVLAPLALVVEGTPASLDRDNVLGYAYLAVVGGALAYTLWFRGIGRLSAPSVSFLGLLSPLVASVLGAVVLAQTLTPLQGLGFALALAGLIAGQLPDHPGPNADGLFRRIRRPRCAPRPPSGPRRSPGASAAPSRTRPDGPRTAPPASSGTRTAGRSSG